MGGGGKSSKKRDKLAPMEDGRWGEPGIGAIAKCATVPGGRRRFQGPVFRLFRPPPFRHRSRPSRDRRSRTDGRGEEPARIGRSRANGQYAEGQQPRVSVVLAYTVIVTNPLVQERSSRDGLERF